MPSGAPAITAAKSADNLPLASALTRTHNCWAARERWEKARKSHTCARACGRSSSRDRILQIEDSGRPRRSPARLFLLARAVSGHEKPGPDGCSRRSSGFLQHERRSAAGGDLLTTLVEARCSKVTIPESVLERLSRLASTHGFRPQGVAHAHGQREFDFFPAEIAQGRARRWCRTPTGPPGARA